MSTAAFATGLLAGAVAAMPGRDTAAARLGRLAPPTTGAGGPIRWLATHFGVRRWRFLALPAGAAASVGLLCLVTLGWPLGPVTGLLCGAGTFWGCVRLSRVGRLRARTDDVDPLAIAGRWDLLAACLRGGLPVSAAVRAVAMEMPGRPGEALRRTAELLALGADPIAAWAPALRDPATAELARGARRSARSGAALAGVADALAAEVRAAATDLAEARAQRAAVAVTAPLGLCFLPAFLCLGVVPVVIGLATRLMAAW